MILQGWSRLADPAGMILTRWSWLDAPTRMILTRWSWLDDPGLLLQKSTFRTSRWTTPSFDINLAPLIPLSDHLSVSQQRIYIWCIFEYISIWSVQCPSLFETTFLFVSQMSISAYHSHSVPPSLRPQRCIWIVHIPFLSEHHRFTTAKINWDNRRSSRIDLSSSKWQSV